MVTDHNNGGTSIQILIAEDDFTSRAVLVAVLKKQGYEVVATVNGAEAWKVMQQPDAPKLAILAWMMPEMDGIEVCRRIRTQEIDHPPYLILLTSKDEKANIITGLEAGADDYLVKPYDPGELGARVRVGLRMIEMQAALIESREALAHEATHDPLTGILNRRAILDQLRKELVRADRHGDAVAVGMCDADHFKQVNDTYGHQTGDEVLRGLVQVLSENLRKYDSIGRMGGEEFLVIAPIKAGTDYTSIFDRLCSRIAESTITTRSGVVSVTVSIGMTCVIAGGTMDEVLSAAAAARYQAHSEGRTRVVCAATSVPWKLNGCPAFSSC